MRVGLKFLVIFFALFQASPGAFAATAETTFSKCENPVTRPIDQHVFLEGLTIKVPWSTFPVSELLPGFQKELEFARSNVRRLEKMKVPRDSMELEKLIWALNSYSSRLTRFMGIVGY